MPSLRTAGGVAALAAAFGYAIGFAVMLTELSDSPSAPAERLGFLLERSAALTAWYLAIYVGVGVALVVLVLALHDELRRAAPALIALGCAFGLIWAALAIAAGMIFAVGLGAAETLHASDPDRAVTLWLVLETLGGAIGGDIELPGGVWLVASSATALRARRFGRALNGLGLGVGLAGILTVVPALGEFAAVFGLGQIVWFVGVGVALLRPGRQRAADDTGAMH